MEDVVQPLNDPKKDYSKLIVALVVVVAVAGGFLTGYLASRVGSKDLAKIAQNPSGGTMKVVVSENEAGIKNKTQFPDETQGVVKLNDGKITKEGTHILVRGTVDQNAYLTSSIVDLDKFVDKNVTVWGQSNKAQKAGWLIDVGWIKVNE